MLNSSYAASTIQVRDCYSQTYNRCIIFIFMVSMTALPGGLGINEMTKSFT